jgi:hypothetical protein
MDGRTHISTDPAYAAELAREQARDEAARRLGKAFAKLDALSDPPPSSEEVQTEIEAARAERRAPL